MFDKTEFDLLFYDNELQDVWIRQSKFGLICMFGVSRIPVYSADLIFVRFKVEFCFFYDGFYRYDSFVIVYSILPIADFHFFVVLVKSGLILGLVLSSTVVSSCMYKATLSARGRCGCDCMLVGFITTKCTYAIRSYHH